jgi:hypothetical protein
MPALNLAALIALFYWGASLYWFLVTVGISGIVLSRTFNSARETGEKAAKSVQTVKAFRAMIDHIEVVKVESKLLIGLQKNLFSEHYKASNQIKRLQYLLQVFEARSNAFYVILNLVFMADIHLLKYADTWKFKNQSKANLWFESVARMEALISLAGTLFTHEEFRIPAIRKSSLEMDFTDVGHPLIASTERITNNFSTGGEGRVVIITGSNMSGKSTFLRTIGVNMVLGLMGGPVCATYAKIPIVTVFSGMRVKDNLEEHISSFYAELKRIRQLLDMLEINTSPVFYLLDEILKGTNSEDRHKGSEALILQLTVTKSLGFVSTHDLILGELGEKSDKILNYNFTSDISGDEIIFDYKIRTGICKSFNASKMMEKMGITLNNL